MIILSQKNYFIQIIMGKIKIMIKNKKTIEVDVNLDTGTVSDLISKIKSKEPNIIFKLITIGGEDIGEDKYKEKLSTLDLEEGDFVTISDYYDGGYKSLFKWESRIQLIEF